MSRLLAAQRALTVPGWVKDELWRRARATPSLDLRFADSKSLVDATTGQNLVTFTRASEATFVNSQGQIQTAAINAPRFDHNPTTGESLGLLVEEQRTNSIRNNTMVGAVAGTPGTLPTNWAYFGVGTLTTSIVEVGTVLGISYFDVRFSGTSSTAQVGVRFEPSNVVAAANGQSWSWSLWSAVVGGSISNITLVQSNCNLFNSSAAFIGGTTAMNLNTSSTFLRNTAAATIAAATTAFIQPQVYFTCASGTAIDITLRIGMPQLEQGAFATSVIPTTGTAATRSADVASITGSAFSGWYRQDEGSFYSVTETLPGVTATSRFILEVNTGIGTASDKWDIRRTGSTAVRTIARIGGVSTADRTESLASSVFRAAAGADGSSVSLAVNGGTITPTANTVGTMPVVTQMQIGNGGDAPTLLLNGHIRRLTYFPQRLANSTLQAITL